MAEKIEPIGAEHRRHGDALQTVGASRKVGEFVREFEAYQGDAERHHQTSQIGTPQHQKARRKTESGSDQPGTKEGNGRLDDDFILGEKACRIGPHAEEGRMAQRDDARIAEDKIERKRKQAPDRGLGKDEMAARQEIDGRESGEPEGGFEWTYARAAGQKAGDSGVSLAGHHFPCSVIPGRGL